MTGGSAASGGGADTASNNAENFRGRDIKKNLMHYAELKKLNTRFYSEVLRKKFFVLYEDSKKSVTNPRVHANGEVSDVSYSFDIRLGTNARQVTVS